jgi:hypothetical protein
MKCRFLAIIVVLLFSLSSLNVYSHSGRTDSSGGHRDNKNKSGLGSYHYHCGGNPPHLHTNGICPYSSNSNVRISAPKSTPKPTPTTIVKQTQTPDQTITVLVNDRNLVLDVPSIIVQGRVLVPLRAIFESLKAEVNWDTNTKTVTGKKGDTVIKLKIDDKYATINGKVKELDIPAKIVNGRTFVPVRFISESLGASVIWDGEKRVVKVNLHDN